MQVITDRDSERPITTKLDLFARLSLSAGALVVLSCGHLLSSRSPNFAVFTKDQFRVWAIDAEVSHIDAIEPRELSAATVCCLVRRIGL